VHVPWFYPRPRPFCLHLPTRARCVCLVVFVSGWAGGCQVDDAAKAEVSEEALAVAREMGRRGLEERLKEINMSGADWEMYEEYFERIAPQVGELREVLDALRHKHDERVWLKHQTSGELDESKLLDGAAGEKLVFKRRADAADQFYDPNKPDAEKPKTRLYFALDVSGSMYRFNSTDGRLERLLECTMMLMEALDGRDRDQGIEYALVGHSGDDAEVPLVSFGEPPRDRRERLAVLQRMAAHSQFCWSGDHTLERVKADASAGPSAGPSSRGAGASGAAGQHFAFVLSDANLRRYGLNPRQIGDALTSDPEVSAHFVMIASGVGDEASRHARAMPPGTTSVCFDAADLPRLIKAILASAIDR